MESWALAPVVGAVKVTVAPVIGLLYASVSVTASGVVAFVPAYTVCGVPVVVVRMAAAPTVLVRIKVCVAFGKTPLFAVMVIGKDPKVIGVPESVALPLPLSMKEIPEGSAPLLGSRRWSP